MLHDLKLRNKLLENLSDEVLSQQHGSVLGRDAFYYPELACRREDRSLFTRLRRELVFQPAWLDNGMPFKRHVCLGSMGLLEASPAFREVVEQLTAVFCIEPVRSLANLYRSGSDWCNLHSDQYDAGHCGINFTIGASFGAERTLLFQERARPPHSSAAGERLQVAIEQGNGDVHAFGQEVNENWRHGVPRSERTPGERISIMLWGYRSSSQEQAAWDLSPLPSPAPSLSLSLLSGAFPHLLHYDPKSSRAPPRFCEGCHQTKSQLGGSVDADHRWCCTDCWAAADSAQTRQARGAQSPETVRECLTVQGAQLAVAVLAGRKTLECRRAELGEGWYGLHVARRPIEPEEAAAVALQWPTVPREEQLPHEALVGLVRLCRPRAGGKQAPETWARNAAKVDADATGDSEDCREDRMVSLNPWFRPGIAYHISHVVALRHTLPARPASTSDSRGWTQGTDGPWRLSPAARRSVLDLIEGMPVYSNPSPNPATQSLREDRGMEKDDKNKDKDKDKDDKDGDKEVHRAGSQQGPVSEGRAWNKTSSWSSSPSVPSWHWGQAEWRSWSWMGSPWTASTKQSWMGPESWATAPGAKAAEVVAQTTWHWAGTRAEAAPQRLSGSSCWNLSGTSGSAEEAAAEEAAAEEAAAEEAAAAAAAADLGVLLRSRSGSGLKKPAAAPEQCGLCPEPEEGDSAALPQSLVGRESWGSKVSTGPDPWSQQASAAVKASTTGTGKRSSVAASSSQRRRRRQEEEEEEGEGEEGEAEERSRDPWSKSKSGHVGKDPWAVALDAGRGLQPVPSPSRPVQEVADAAWRQYRGARPASSHPRRPERVVPTSSVCSRFFMKHSTLH